MKKLKIIFLISLPRSGSTLLQKMLTVSETISSVSEPWIMLPIGHLFKENGSSTVYSHKTAFFAIQDFIDRLPEKEEDFFECIRNFITSLYQKIPSGENAKYFLDKTPRYYLIMDLLIKIFPDAKFIILYRNPLEVLASILTTWHGNKFTLYRHYVDIFYGPVALTEGHFLVRNNSISTNYNNLVLSPEHELKRICNYLDILYEERMIRDYKKVNLKGMMGDQIGINNYNRINIDSLLKWKEVLNTEFRKRFAKRYVSTLGNDVLGYFDTSVDELIRDIETITDIKQGSFKDMFYYSITNLKRYFLIENYKKIIKMLRQKETIIPYT